MMMKTLSLNTLPAALALALGLLGGCAGLPAFNKPASAPAPLVETMEPVVTLPAMGAGRTAAAYDRSTAAQKAAAVAAPSSAGRSLGKVVVALGSPAEQGFWLRSPLVAVAGQGRVSTAAGGGGAGGFPPPTRAGRLSLAAFRALGLGLTDLPEVSVSVE